MNQRDRVRMSPQETAAMLAGGRKVQLATINADGTPHLVTMYYAMVDGQIAFWTYRTSQKARNLARDPRLTCLVESGCEYFDLRGVQVNGVARCLTAPGDVLKIGAAIAASMGGVPADALESYVASAAKKRHGYLVEPTRIVSWDHTKLV